MLLALSIYSACPCKEKKQIIKSPDRNISVRFRILKNNTACYTVRYAGKSILRESKLGIIREDENFSENLSLDSVSSIETVKDDYEMLQGKKRKYSYSANRKVFHLKNANGRKMDIIFQVSNDGVAFRYYFPEKSNKSKKSKKKPARLILTPAQKHIYSTPRRQNRDGARLIPVTKNSTNRVSK